jgi:uncharacterized membrane protein (UPF0127 family)
MAVLRNATTGQVVASNVIPATHWWARLTGLLSRGHITPEEGVWFDNCDAVHTVGMRAPIDIVFLDSDSRVLRVAPCVPPMRIAVVCVGAKAVIELGEGSSARDVLQGDRLLLE